VPDWLAAVLALVGVALGYAGASHQEMKRWRRDWLDGVMATRREQYASLIEAMDSEYIVLSRAAEGDPVRQERAEESAAAWRTQRARSRVLAAAGVQHASEQFDRAREAVIVEINANRTGPHSAVARLVDARAALFDAMNDDLMQMNRIVIRAHMSPWQRLLQREALASLSVAEIAPTPDGDSPCAG
jgi:hypothetical protein